MLLYTIGLLTSCDDFIERNISKSKVEVITPADQFVSSDINIKFFWQELKGARSYQLQAVKGSFTSPTAMTFDTTVTTNYFNFQFTPGNYSWRIRGLNNGYETEYSNFLLSIDSSLDLTAQTPVLINPTSDYYTNRLENTFTWVGIPNAEEYRFEISDLAGEVLFVNDLGNLTNQNYTFDNDGTYRWRVQARNTNSISNFSNYRNITIKTTASSPSSPVIPINNDTIAIGDIEFLWQRNADSNADSLFLYKDSLSNMIPIGVYYSDYFIYTTPVNYPAGTKIYWRLKTKDLAGNWSDFSSIFYFTLKD